MPKLSLFAFFATKDGTYNRFEPQLWRNASQWMKKVQYKYRPYIQIKRSGQIRLLSENDAWVSCETFYVLRRTYNAFVALFLDSIRFKMKVSSNYVK